MAGESINFTPSPETYSDKLEQQLIEKQKEFAALKKVTVDIEAENNGLKKEAVENAKVLIEMQGDLTSSLEEKEKREESTTENLLKSIDKLKTEINVFLEKENINEDEEEAIKEELKDLSAKEDELTKVAQKQSLAALKIKTKNLEELIAKSKPFEKVYEALTGKKISDESEPSSFKIGYDGT